MLQCGYHGWVYRLDGSLAKTGRAADDPHLVAAELGLQTISVDEFAQGVFVNPSPNAGRLVDSHAGLADVASQIGIDPDLDRYQPFATYTVSQASNWKLWYDNGTECYHCPLVHKNSFGAAYNTTDGIYDPWNPVHPTR